MTQVYSYVRFSSPQQAKGASYARQTEATEKWATLRGYTLAPEKFYDEGVSSYDGSNVKDGRLGDFLGLIKSGIVVRGSILVVENLDRVSRDDIFSALKIFQEIVYAGITLVTLNDGMEYTEAKLRAEQSVIFTIVGTFLRGRQESDTKSVRVRDALQRKRKNLSVKKWDTSFPPWLKLNADKTAFTVDEDKANVIRRIFKDYDNGLSTNRIAIDLQNEGVERPYWKKTKYAKAVWPVTTVMDYLTSRSVIGEYQPKERIKGKKDDRVDVGPLQENYYPVIVEREVFLRVNAKIAAKKKVRGRRCEDLVNIFRGMLRCPYCGGTLMLNRQKRPKLTIETFICDHSHHFKQDCLRYGWKRRDFEECFMEFATEVHTEYTKFHSQRFKSNANEVERIRNELKEVDRIQKRLLPAYEAEAIDLKQLTERSRELKDRKAGLEKELTSATIVQTPEQVTFDLGKFLDGDLNDTTKREQLADVVSRLFDRIEVYFVGLPSRYQMIKTAQKRYLEQGRMKPSQVFGRLNKLLPFQRERFFVAYMKDGKRMSWPAALFNNPELTDLYGRKAGEEFKRLGLSD